MGFIISGVAPPPAEYALLGDITVSVIPASTMTYVPGVITETFCDIYSAEALYCNDMSGEIPPGVNMGISGEPGNNGNATHINIGYTNVNLTETGATRVTLINRTEDDGGLYFPKTSVGLGAQSGQINFGFMMRMGPDFLDCFDWDNAFAGSGSKLITMLTQTQGAGANDRPTCFMQPVEDTRNETGLPVNSRADTTNPIYWIPRIASDANGTDRVDEWGAGNPQAQQAYDNGSVHAFKFNDYIGQWIYCELEYVPAASLTVLGTGKFYVYTPDSVFQGGKGAPGVPLCETVCRTLSDVLPWITGSVPYYVETVDAASPNSFIDIDDSRLDNVFMGPPAGFT